MQRPRPISFWFVFLVGLLLWAGTGACSCGNLLARFLPSPTPAIPTPALPTPTFTAAPLLPQGNGQPIEIIWTQEDLNDYLASQALNQQGLEVSDIQATLGQGEVTVSFYARHTQSGLSGEITLIGKPIVAEGKIYVQIADVTLGPSFAGFTRLIAENLFREALKQYGSEAGIPVPTEGIIVESVEITPGQMIVRGYKP